MSYNSTTGASQLYTINLTTAVATPVGTGFTIVPGVTGSAFGFDFNPLVDRIRLIAGSNATAANNGANYRLNPNDGTLAATDTSVAYAAGDPGFGTVPQISAAAYTNNVSGGTTTTLYAFNWANDDLVRVGSLNGAPISPNTGQLFTVGDSGVVTGTRTLGFDISGASNTAYANLDLQTSATNDNFYTVNLATGAVTSRGTIGAGVPVLDISVRIQPPLTTLGFSSSTYRDDESQSATIVITKAQSTVGPTTATVNFSGGTATGGAACGTGIDYVNTPQNVLLPSSGPSSVTITVPLCGDVTADTNETFNVSITNVPAETGVLGIATVTINDTANQFRNTNAIQILQGTASNPYPSNIVVSGATTNTFRVRVTLYDFYHDQPDNVDVLLVGPNGAKYVLMGDVGGNLAVPGPPNAVGVTLTLADYPATTLPDAGPLATGIYKPTTCEPVSNFPSPAPAGPYVEPGCLVARPNAQTLYGNFANTTANGTWSLYVRDDNGLARPLAPEIIRGEVSGGWGIELLPSTAAGVEVSGRVLTADGRGLRNAVVTMTDASGNFRTATTGSFGYYRFEDVEVGSTQIIRVDSKRYNYNVRLVQVLDTLTDVDFISNE